MVELQANTRREKVYLLHEYGSPGHYAALVHLLRENGLQPVFAEFGVLRQFARGLRRRQLSLCWRSLRNVLLLLGLMLAVRRQRILFGMAPFDSSILLLMALARHRIYLHSSWPYWDLSRQPHTPWRPLRSLVLAAWRRWCRTRVEHAFFVTRLAQSNNQASAFAVPASSVVGHSFDAGAFFGPAQDEVTARPVRLAYVGRLEQPKGILDFLELAQRDYPFPVEFHIVGKGEQQAAVDAAVAACPGRLFYAGYIHEAKRLGEFFRSMDFLLNPAQRTAGWEELFGMTLIEAGACGVISWATAHPGPLEILEHSPAGGCLPESDFMQQVMQRVADDLPRLHERKQQLAAHFAAYALGPVAQRWRAVLDETGRG